MIQLSLVRHVHQPYPPSKAYTINWANLLSSLPCATENLLSKTKLGKGFKLGSYWLPLCRKRL